MPYAFISYVTENRQQAHYLCLCLREYGIDYWLDREHIAPGQRWQLSIRQAIEHGAFFIACFSREYLERENTYMNEELALAIEELQKHTKDRTWFIPVLLTSIPLPDLDIGDGETLRNLHSVDLSEDWESGVRRLIETMNLNVTLDKESAEYIRKIKGALGKQSESGLITLLIDLAISEASKEEKNYGYILRPICEAFGEYLSVEQVVRMVTRGKGNSRTGFHGLDTLYDEHYEHLLTLRLPEAFLDNPRIQYYCRLREKFPELSLREIIRGDTVLDGLQVNADYFFDKYENRGNSAFLDAVFSTDEAA